MRRASRILHARDERWPLALPFRLSRGTKTEVHAVVVEITQGERTGWGECIPYPRYGESVATVMAAIAKLAEPIAAGLSRAELRRAMPAGAARNAIDCALWDLEARLAGQPVWALAGLARPGPLTTAYTLVIEELDALSERARAEAGRPLLKVKADASGIIERLETVHRAAPNAKLIVDANESWDLDTLTAVAPKLAALGAVAIEQPLPASDDAKLRRADFSIPIVADESFHGLADLDAASERYAIVNIKLDKTGGLTEALELASRARDAGLGVMIGCMASTSLSLAPALVLGGFADLVDLDAGLLLRRDREGGVRYRGSVIEPEPALWGTGR